MNKNIIIRKRKSVKKGVTFEYRFETAPVCGQRKWISKSGFKTERLAFSKAYKTDNIVGLSPFQCQYRKNYIDIFILIYLFDIEKTP